MAAPTIKQFVYRRGAQKRIPVSGTFELTPRCNLSCKMCYVRMSAEEQRQRGVELTTEEWLSIAREAVKEGMIYLLLTGGEPLLRPDFTEIYRGIIQMGVVISVNTNATLVTPEIVECFKQHVRSIGKESHIQSLNDAKHYFCFFLKPGSHTYQRLLLQLKQQEEDNAYRFEQRNPDTGERSYCGIPIPHDAPPRPNVQAVWDGEKWIF